MHNVAVAFDLHEFGHAHRAEFCNPSNIIARKIDKHNVFGAFLGIGEQVGGISFVLCCRRAPRARPCNGANFNRFAYQPDMHLWRTPNERKIITGFKTKHVRRGIDETETPIKIERFAGKIAVEAL